MSIFRTLLILASTFLYLPAAAQQPSSYTFHHLSMTDGLAGNHVSAILQDKKGFIWIASTALQRYDGKQFVTVSQFDRLPGSIYYDDIALYEDSKSRIWMGTPENIRMYDPVTAEVKAIPFEAGLQTGRNIDCHSILQDHNKVLWATTKAGLVYFDEKQQQFRKPAGLPDSARLQMSSAIMEDQEGRLWISGKWEVYLLGKDRKTLYCRTYNPENISALTIHTSVKTLYQDKNQWVWMAGRGDKSMYAWRPDNNTLRDYHFTYDKAHDQVYDISSDMHGRIWVAMERGGLHRYSHALDSFNLHIPGNKDDDLGLHLDYEVNCMFSDREGHMWVGTDHGINIMSLHNQTFSRLDHRARFPNTDQQLPNAEVTGVFNASNGDVYIGYWGEGVAWLDPQLRLKEHFNNLPEKRKQIWCFAEMRNGDVLIGQENGYISRFDPKKKTFQHFRPEGLDEQVVLTMFPESDTCVWVGIYNEGMVQWNPERNTSRTYPQITQYIQRSTSIMNILPQGDSMLWLAASNGGILRFNKKLQRIDKQVLFRYQGLNVRNVTSLLFYNDSTLLAGTNHGLYYYNIRRNTWRAQQINESQFDEWILSMHSAGGQDVWLTTAYGFYRLSGKDRRLMAFIQNDDIIDNHRMVRRNIATMPDGWMLVGASDHVTAFAIDHLQVKPPPPDVTITDFKVLERSIIVDSVIDNDHSLMLDHSQNFISIEFKSLQYHEVKTRYYYRLLGVDAAWVPTENLLVARYTQLPPGEYTFMVKSMNMAGVFSKGITTLKIHIRPAFWQTWWFRSLCMLLVLGLIYGYFRFRLYLVKKNEKDQAAFREELAKLEMKALRAQMNPHFIFNSLNSIQTFMMKNETEQALAYLSRFARLIRNVLDNSQFNSISISRETSMLENYLELEKLRLDNTFDCRIIIDPALDSDFVEIPAMVIQPFVENAIWHGLLHRKGGDGLLKIEFIKEDNKIHCIVEDNGIGREAATAFRMQSHPSHVSRGLQITKDRLQIYNSRFNMDASFDIEDLYDEEGKPRGTRVNLWFPLEDD